MFNVKKIVKNKKITHLLASLAENSFVSWPTSVFYFKVFFAQLKIYKKCTFLRPNFNFVFFLIFRKHSYLTSTTMISGYQY